MSATEGTCSSNRTDIIKNIVMTYNKHVRSPIAPHVTWQNSKIVKGAEHSG